MLGAFGGGTLSNLSGRRTPQLLGTIFSEATWANLNDFTVVGNATPVISATSSKLHFTGGTGGTIFTNYIEWTKAGGKFTIHCLEKWKQRVKVTTPASLSASTLGFGLGVRSQTATTVQSNSIRWAWDGAGYLVYLYFANSTSGQMVSGAGLTPTANTTYVLEVQRLKNVYTVTIYDSGGVTQLYQTTFTTTLTSPASGQMMHNTGYFSMENFGGTFDVLDWTVTSDAQTKIDVVGVGDSNMHGLYVGTGGGVVTDRYTEKCFTSAGLTWEILAGVGDHYGDALAAIETIKGLEPRNVYINLGSNDVADGVATATWKANLDSLISGLEGVGIVVKLGTPIARTTDLTTVQTYVNGKTEQVCDIFAATKNGTTLLPAYNTDGVHMNLTGNNAIASLLRKIIY